MCVLCVCVCVCVTVDECLSICYVCAVLHQTNTQCEKVFNGKRQNRRMEVQFTFDMSQRISSNDVTKIRFDVQQIL